MNGKTLPVLFAAYRDGDMVTAVTEEGLQYFAELYEDKEDDVRERFLGDNTKADEQYAAPDDPKDFHTMGKWLYKRGAFFCAEYGERAA